MELLEVNAKALDTCPEEGSSEKSFICDANEMKADDSDRAEEVRTNSFEDDSDKEECLNNNNIEDSNSTHSSRIEEGNENVSQGLPDFLPRHTKYEEKDWNDLPSQAQQAAEVLGLNQISWDAKGWCPCEDKGWYGLSEEEREAATLLGWDRPSWDTQYDDFDWVDLPQHVKDASTELGFDQHMWDHDEWPHQLESRHWQDLTDGEQCLLYVLGYSKHIWDDDDSIGRTSREEESDSSESSESSEGSESEYDSSTIATGDSLHSPSSNTLDYEEDSQGDTEIRNNVSVDASAIDESELLFTTIENNDLCENDETNFISESFETAMENEDEKERDDSFISNK